MEMMFHRMITGLAMLLLISPILGGCEENSSKDKLVQEQKRRMMETELDMYILNQNKILPAMQDKNTRWDSVSRDENLFYYNFSVVGLGDGSFSSEIFDQSVAPALLEQTCQDAARRNLIDNGYTIVFNYVDEGKNPLTELRISREKCESK